MEAALQLPGHQKDLEDHQFRLLFQSLSLPNRAQLLSASSPHASAWLQVVPAPGLNRHLEVIMHSPASTGVMSGGSRCSLCPDSILDPLGHYATTCKRGGDVVHRHNLLRDVLADSCRLAHLSVKVEVGKIMTTQDRHADVLVHNWSQGKPAAFDFSVTSPLNSLNLSEVGVSSEIRKQNSNDGKCGDLGWVCIPLVVEMYGGWGQEAVKCFAQ